MMYFGRLNSENINQLLKEAHILNKKLHSEGMYSWYTLASKIFIECDLDITEFENFDKPFLKIKKNLKCNIKQKVEDNYKNKIMQKLSSFTDDSKLFLYKQIKTEFGLEKYLLKETSFKNRQLLTQLRVSDHKLNIELGRYRNIARENRLCSVCEVVEDEYHFLLHCNINKELRRTMFYKLNLNQYIDFNNQIIHMHQILNPNLELIPIVCDL